MTRILVVDDSALMHALYRQVLGRFDRCALSFARDGREALASIDRDGEPELIVLDINMPTMNGLECLEHLGARGTAARVPVVIVSTEGTTDDEARGRRAGARAYLRKPFRPEELRAVVENLLVTAPVGAVAR